MESVKTSRPSAGAPTPPATPAGTAEIVHARRRDDAEGDCTFNGREKDGGAKGEVNVWLRLQLQSFSLLEEGQAHD